MNTKKNKGKSKANKPQNPNPPQKVEEPIVDVEKKEDPSVGETESAPKSDLRVPEIISEVITPAVEEKEKEDDNPKKPKRNRGKKKKQEKDEDEYPDDKPTESVEVIETIEVEMQGILVEENITPSARKKKTKNKKAAESTEKAEKVPDAEQKTEQTITDIKEEVVTPDVSEQEVKQSKKKNKKKKRNDSERSEKAEEVSCTSAFQMLLKDDKTEAKTAENQPSESAKTVSKDEKKVTDIMADITKADKGKNKDISKQEPVPGAEEIKERQETPTTPTPSEPGNKNKKKNKKDKKELPKEKEIQDDDSFDMPEIVPITDFTPITETLSTVELKEAVVEKQAETLIPENVSSAEDVKPKAKIAKPVEKKKKGKDHVQDLPEISTTIEPEPLEKIQEMQEKDKRSLIICELQEVTMDAAESKSDTTRKESETIAAVSSEVKTTEKIDLPETDENKKRKKSPKPGKQAHKPEIISEVDVKPEISQEKDIPPLPQFSKAVREKHPIMNVKSEDALITEAFEELIRIPESDKSKKRKKSPKPTIQEQKTSLAVEPPKDIAMLIQEEIKPISQKEPKIVEPEIIPLPPLPKESKEFKTPIPEETKKELLPESKDKKDELDTKSKKKRKKSPKPPTESEKVSETKKASSEIKTEDHDSDKKCEEPSKEKAENIFDMPLAEEIEISSLKADESESSSCGFTPDIIQHPRATSQDLIDDNNNMMIQEITIEEVKLQVPTDIPDAPFIQGSGETPLSTPECAFVGVQISEVIASVPKIDEKTDIKSKMMEVNQDMEELRLSIERSLAELTSIEKSEQAVEKKIEEKTVHTPDAPKSPEVKISMPSELMSKSQPEKSEISIPKDKKKEKRVPSPKPDVAPTPVIALPFSQDTQSKDSKKLETKQPEKTVSLGDILKPAEKITETITPPIAPARKDKSVSKERDIKHIPLKSDDIVKPTEIVQELISTPQTTIESAAPPAVPARKDNKNKSKNKKKGKQESSQATSQSEATSSAVESKEPEQKSDKKEEKSTQKADTKQDKGKQQSNPQSEDSQTAPKDGDQSSLPDFEPIEDFEDAMTSSADDINKTFEMIATDAAESQFREASHLNPEIKIVAPIEDTKPDKKDEKVNHVSPPKNLLGHPDIPVPSNRTDYKKEKNKAPNTILAKVKIKDAVQIEGKKETKDTQTENIRKFMKNKSIDESFSSVTNENDEFVYKYSFRKVFLQSACHTCKKELKQTRVPCNFCNLIFYCNAKHKDEDWNKHRGFCFAVSTIVHLKDQKHIYADSKNITGQDYRLLRMQMIVSCEKVLKRKLTPFEQEALLYPRVCADAACREWRQNKLTDCDGCGQISFCTEHPDHFPKSHQRWCKSYSLYQKLVCYQQTKGRLEPKLPSRIVTEQLQVSEKMNEVLAAMYEEKIDMNDIQYAALTQIATAPLTTAFCLQAYAKLANHTNGISKKTTCTIHIVGGELQFEADALNKWEVFFLHLRPDLQELRVVMVGRELNPSNLPLELLGKVKMCENCRVNKRRVVFSFQDNTTYYDYWASDAFLTPDIVCAFNPSIKRSSMYNGKDPWPKTINCVLKLEAPFFITAYTMNELQKDLARIKDCSEVDHKLIIEPKFNSFASVRPDRNFISDDEMPLLFKNYCYALVGAN